MKQLNYVKKHFFNVSMSNGHVGLSTLAQKEGVDVDKLKPGEFVLFWNKSFNAMKFFTAGYGLIHFKTPDGGPFNVKAARLIPEFFTGRSIGYSDALKKVVMDDFRARYPRLYQEYNLSK